jgi:ABC-type transport system involved in multi-copper enzyme maturation permease subunit|uniref:ABC-type transport system protein n=1 Tax=Chloracidobacterium thermophilum TaxID=458033 RepID=A8DJC4_9BACT|nr:ABC-type transport system protein [Chloracidobacterium thermophilum]
MKDDLRGIVTLALLTFHEARQRKVLLLAFLLGLLFLGLFAWGVRATARQANAMGPVTVRLQLNLLTLAGLYVINFLVAVTAVALPVDTLSGDIASGLIHTLLTKPLRRAAIVIGKWSGFLILLTLYFGFMAGGVLGVTWLTASYVPPGVFAAFPLMWLGAVVLLTMTIAGGTRLSTLANGVVIFGLYGIAFIGGWMERIGTVLGNTTARNLGIASSLLVPTEAMWQYAATLMQPALLRQVGLTPFSAVSTPSPLMVVWAVGCVAVNLGLAVWWFARRDL